VKTRYTYVCKDCHAGWEFTVPGPAEPGEEQVYGFAIEKAKCRWCGELGTLRGMYLIRPVT
jgi:hypothetical protein